MSLGRLDFVWCSTDNGQLTQQTQTATQVQYDRAGNAMQMADAEIARFRAILHEIDELQVAMQVVTAYILPSRLDRVHQTVEVGAERL